MIVAMTGARGVIGRSHRNVAELVHRALVTPYTWAVVYGTPANHRRL